MSLHSLGKGPTWSKSEESVFLLTSSSKLEKLSLTRLRQRLLASWIQYLSEFVWNLEAKTRLKWLSSESHVLLWFPFLSFQSLTCLFQLPRCHPTDMFLVPCCSQSLLALPGDPTDPQCSMSGALGREADGGAVHSATPGGRWRGS